MLLVAHRMQVVRSSAIVKVMLHCILGVFLRMMAELYMPALQQAASDAHGVRVWRPC
jgi:hypothetical protein